MVERLRLAARLPRTPEITDRRALLREFATAQAGPRYFVGDGLEGGRPATREDIIRLVGLEGCDPHPGLVRCDTCRELAGDFFATNGEGNGDLKPRVIRVHCRCENHNSCAWCGEPLAEHRLSAYHFLEDLDAVCYVAAYCGFSHRCPRMSPAASTRTRQVGERRRAARDTDGPAVRGA